MRAYLKQEIKNPGWGERERERDWCRIHTQVERSMVYLDCGDRLVIYSRFVSIRARLVTSDVTMSTT